MSGTINIANVTASGTITDGTASLTSGSWTGLVGVTASGTVSGGTITDGTATMTGGALASLTTVTASGQIQGGTLTDGTATVSSGAVSGVTTLGMTGNMTMSNDSATITHSGSTSLSITSTSGSVNVEGVSFVGDAISSATTIDASSTITGGSLTDGTATLSSGALSGVTTLGVSDTVTMSEDEANITHSGATSLTIASTSGTVVVEGVTFTGGVMSGLTDPSNAQEAATKNYVDTQVQTAEIGLDVKPSARVATTQNGTYATAFANGETVDGITLATNDVILIKDQTDASENGLHVVQASGAPTRHTDMDGTTEFTGAFVFVTDGTANANTGWVCNSKGTITAGTDDVNFEQFNALQGITAGDGLTKTGATLNVVGGSGITVADNSVSLTAANTNMTSASGLTTIGSAGADLTIDGGTTSGSGTSKVVDSDDNFILAGAVASQDGTSTHEFGPAFVLGSGDGRWRIVPINTGVATNGANVRLSFQRHNGTAWVEMAWYD